MQNGMGWRGRSPGQRLLAALWLLVLAAGFGLALRRAWISDDIYITFRYCDNVLAGRGPVYNPGERTEGYSHFIWFILLTVGRALGLPAELLGKYGSFPLYAGLLALLVWISGRLFPGRGGLWGAPVAAVGLALHPDVRIFASGGLETTFFALALLLGIVFLTLSQHRRHAALGGWALAMAALARPEGAVFALLAGAWLVWKRRSGVREFALVWLVLVGPQLAFRLAYYGYPLPNPYYAKSGAGAYWAQGRIYTELYFYCYFVLAIGFLAIVPTALALLRGRPRRLRGAAPVLLLAFAAAVTTVVYVTRVGGDFMFGRFYVPITPLLLLLVESLVHLLPRPALRVAGALAVGGLAALGGTRKMSLLHDKYQVSGIVDEPQFYPASRFAEMRQSAEILRRCFEGTDAIIMVQGGQASLAYYARFPIAFERYGLTDEHIAHSPIRRRERPGHEKQPTPEYIYQRGVHLRLHARPVRNLAVYTQFDLRGVPGEIIVYDRELMEHVKRCGGARFLDFPVWLERYYIPVELPQRLPKRLVHEWGAFHRFYFDHNPDPENLREKLRLALAARGITDLPMEPPASDLFQDSGRPSGTD